MLYDFLLILIKKMMLNKCIDSVSFIECFLVYVLYLEHLCNSNICRWLC
jgi:hypothetical protein